MNYTFYVINQRDKEANEAISITSKIVAGIELATPEYARRIRFNLDHHGSGTTPDDPSACELALGCPLLPIGTRFVTDRADADSVTAMAVLELRCDRTAYNYQLVHAVGNLDRYGSHAKGFEEYRDMCIAIGRVATDSKCTLGMRVAWVMDALTGIIDPEEVKSLVADHDRELEELQSTITLCLDGRLAEIRSSHKRAMELGYELADIVMTINQYPLDPNHPEADTHKKYTIGRRSNHARIDMELLLERLNKAEKGAGSDGLWSMHGNYGNIIESPQGHDTALSEIQVYSFVWSSMTDNDQHLVRH